MYKILLHARIARNMGKSSHTRLGLEEGRLPHGNSSDGTGPDSLPEGRGTIGSRGSGGAHLGRPESRGGGGGGKAGWDEEEAISRCGWHLESPGVPRRRGETLGPLGRASAKAGTCLGPV